MTVTKLFFNSNKQLVGYYTLFNDTVPKIGKDKLKKEHWDLPKSEKFYPAVRLHYIGVDDKYRDQDIGYTMLMSAIDTCYNIYYFRMCFYVSSGVKEFCWLL
ncbi:MAG: family acetyltransferase [Bacillales bacterium]|jgi:hypothetical protein|nr:family acetyltransferase [Bacillales bacterium]MDF2789376.1 family acetyltransferase [Neobacillus sp.]